MDDELDLFLSPYEDGGQALDGLNRESLSQRAGSAGTRPNFRDLSQDANKLSAQSWTVVAPDDDNGDRLVEIIQPLIKHRQEQCRVTVIKMPRLTRKETVDWVEANVVGNKREADIPGYALIVGGFDGVSLGSQQALAKECFTGRIAFDDPQHYESYVQKLIRSDEKRDRAEDLSPTRSLFFCARDGTPATALGNSWLIQPSMKDVEAGKADGSLAVGEILALEDEDPVRAGNLLLDTAAEDQPTFLFSCSHGMGAPRRGWGDDTDKMHKLQGALCLGNGKYIAGSDMVNKPFLPGGMWMFFACFGAGTPDESAYYHWLAQLKETGQYGGRLSSVLKALPRKSSPFLASLPKAVLANGNGPLAVIGHLDLAWSYSFQEFTASSALQKYRRFETLVSEMINGGRAGVAHRKLLDKLRSADEAILLSNDEAARARQSGEEPVDDRVAMSNKWMLRQDVDGYVLLGDPAARLAVSGRSDAGTEEAWSREEVAIYSEPGRRKVETKADVAGASAHGLDFGLFGGKDKDNDNDKEPGFFARLAGQITDTLSKLLTDAATLEVRTYRRDSGEGAPVDGDALIRDPDTRLIGYTRIKLDGDIDSCRIIPDEGDDADERELWAMHLDMVKHAQKNRNKTLKILLSLFPGGRGL